MNLRDFHINHHAGTAHDTNKDEKTAAKLLLFFNSHYT